MVNARRSVLHDSSLVRQLAIQSHVLVENFKPGSTLPLFITSQTNDLILSY